MDQMEYTEGWESLPAEILSIVLHKVLERNPLDPSRPWPLSTVYRQCTALSLVCKHWGAVLYEHPPPLHICISAAPPEAYDWMARFPIESLIICEGMDPTALNTPRADSCFPSPIYGEIGSIATFPPYYILTDLVHLRSLELHLPLWLGARPAEFRASNLEHLTRLTRLVLSGFIDYNLEGLQPTVRHLELSYAERWLPDVLSSHSISIPRIPENIRLDTLIIKKVGVIGLLMEELWDRVKNIQVDAMFVLAGVPVPDRDLVTFFERPYREGDYVPPHLLGDWDAIEASNRAADATADHLLSGMACCSMLERINFTGECSVSIKLVPAVAGGGAVVAVPWLHNITQQATLFLYGMSGAELLDRVIDMRSAGKLSSSSVGLEVFLSDTVEKAFTVEVKHWAEQQQG